MPLSEDQIRQLAKLARLRQEPADMDRLRGELERMMEQVAKVQEADISGLELRMNLGDSESRMRADEPQATAGDLAEGAASHAGGAVLVPKVIT